MKTTTNTVLLATLIGVISFTIGCAITWRGQPLTSLNPLGQLKVNFETTNAPQPIPAALPAPPSQ